MFDKYKIENAEIKENSVSLNENIILPIKPNYAYQIFNREKQYEYRKKLCKRDIGKIYVYATAPIKKVIGEAAVLEKMEMEKEELWDKTKFLSGISKTFYDAYFQKQKYACAYRLGEVIKYEHPIALESLGIAYAPQSFVYCGDLTGN